MKNKIKIAVTSLCAIGVATLFFNRESGKSVDELLLENVEALASEEVGGPVDCLGIGEVDCPRAHEKVKYVMSGYSLEKRY